jgi:RHS repeat-associated protein
MLGLINMNGRLYDPQLGRMLSPDPYVVDPTSTQDYNRYSYVLNNPLRYTDPTGYIPMIPCPSFGKRSVFDNFRDWWNTWTTNLTSNLNKFFSLFESIDGDGGGGCGGAGWGFGGGFGDGGFGGFGGDFAGGFMGGGYDAGGGSWLGNESVREIFQRGVELIETKGYTFPGVLPSGLIRQLIDVWFPGAPNNGTIINIHTGGAKIDANENPAYGAVEPGFLGNKLSDKLTGKSTLHLYEIAFSSYQRLFWTIGHELMHVSQYAALALHGLTNSQIDNNLSLTLNHGAYEFQGLLGWKAHVGIFTTNELGIIVNHPYFWQMKYGAFDWTKPFRPK